jgi:hypothetical protein
MSDYKIGKDLGRLESRIARLEELARSGENSKNEDSEEPKINDNAIAMMGPNGIIVEPEAFNKLGYPTPEMLKVRTSGGCGRFNDGFPTYANYSWFRGNIWLQRKDNGDIITFHYIETGYNTRCNVRMGTGTTTEVRNSKKCPYGWEGRDLPGRLTFGLWARFRFEDGYGYDISGLTCYC